VIYTEKGKQLPRNETRESDTLERARRGEEERFKHTGIQKKGKRQLWLLEKTNGQREKVYQEKGMSPPIQEEGYVPDNKQTRDSMRRPKGSKNKAPKRRKKTRGWVGKRQGPSVGEKRTSVGGDNRTAPVVWSCEGRR